MPTQCLYSSYITPYTPETVELGGFIAEFLSRPLGADIKVTKREERERIGSIHIIIDEKSHLPKEGYRLSVTQQNIRIEARSTQGAFWAFQTVRQLLPKEVEKEKACQTLALPCVMIEDSPVLPIEAST